MSRIDVAFDDFLWSSLERGDRARLGCARIRSDGLSGEIMPKLVAIFGGFVLAAGWRRSLQPQVNAVPQLARPQQHRNPQVSLFKPIEKQSKGSQI